MPVAKRASGRDAAGAGGGVAFGSQDAGQGLAPLFELDRGRVSIGADPHVLVPVAALLATCRAAGERAARELGRATGASVGERLGRRLGHEPRESFAEAIDALGAELGWLGLGALIAERWGSALVFRLDGGPLDGHEEVDALLSGILEGAIEAWTGRPAQAVVIDRDPDRLRVLIGGPRAVGMAQALVQAGADHHEILRRLHEHDDAARQGGAG
jgi:hypothetical protein